MEHVDVPPPFPIRPLPAVATRLLVSHRASPRLTAHLAHVHDVACELIDHIVIVWPSLRFDADAVRIGAATHDAGKLICRDELREPGTQHEAVGEELLMAQGLPPNWARFARTHARSWAQPDAQLEDWLVATADVIWKGERHRMVEDRIIDEIVVRTGHEP